jgi:protein tyrosine phosphatase (PTP) superfamily phosphohydrolase (DUF442 family)
MSSFQRGRIALAALLCAGTFLVNTQAADAPKAVAGIVAPNVVVVSPNLVTAGQPTRESLLQLNAEGYAAVISLAPGNTADAVADEAAILKAQGIEFVHVPIPWQTPEASHLAATAAALQRFQGRKVLVHCQMNMRASAVTFLYRAIYAKEDPAAAWADVKKTWTPDGQWAKFVDDQLLANGIAFKAR